MSASLSLLTGTSVVRQGLEHLRVDVLEYIQGGLVSVEPGTDLKSVNRAVGVAWGVEARAVADFGYFNGDGFPGRAWDRLAAHI